MLSPMAGPASSDAIPLTGGEMDDDPIDTVLSEAASGLPTLGAFAFGGVGGASPLPLPRMRPPPSLRPDMVEDVPFVVVMGGREEGKGKSQSDRVYGRQNGRTLDSDRSWSSSASASRSAAPPFGRVGMSGLEVEVRILGEETG